MINIKMKDRIYLLTLFLLLRIGFSDVKAQSMIIKLNDVSENTEALNTVRKLTFSASDLLVVFNSGSTDAYGLSTVKKVYFDTSISIDENEVDPGLKLTIYPNPATNIITVRGIPDGTKSMLVYRADGQLVLMKSVANMEENMDLSSLPRGLYLLNANGFTAKFIKQ